MDAVAAEYRKWRDDVLTETCSRLQNYVQENMIGIPRIDRISARVKGEASFAAKAGKLSDGSLKYDDPLREIQDVIGLRIVVFYRQDVAAISQIVESLFRHVERRLIEPESDSDFSYFGQHYVCFLPEDVQLDEADVQPTYFELQIKTLFQHAWSEANHDLGYKSEEGLSPEQKRLLAFASAQAWGGDRAFEELFDLLRR